MARRKRRGTEPGEFVDPLRKYDSPVTEDALEVSLREDAVLAVQTTPYSMMAPQATVEQVLQLMHERNIGCVIIAENDRLVGIFSERDAMMKVAENYEAIKDQPVSQYMTRDPVSVYETDTPAKAMNLMAVGSFRHIPVLDVDEKIVGMVGPKRITTYLQKFIS